MGLFDFFGGGSSSSPDDSSIEIETIKDPITGWETDYGYIRDADGKELGSGRIITDRDPITGGSWTHVTINGETYDLDKS